jgi:polar amino acid transport system ATP-binding protein
MTIAPAIRIQNLTKRFGDKVVLNGVNLEVERGQVTCLIGPSGSGKSTLLRCLAFLEEPNDGLIEIDGEPLGFAVGPLGKRKRLPPASVTSVRRHIGMVFQQPRLPRSEQFLETYLDRRAAMLL